MRPARDDADQRRRELAQIHCLAKDLALDEDTYRAMLWTIARVDSAAALDEHGRRQVIRHLRAKAEAAGVNTYRRRQTPAQSKRALVAKIRALLIHAQPRRDDAYADAMSRHMFGVSRFTWLDHQQLRKLVAALEIDKRRKPS